MPQPCTFTGRITTEAPWQYLGAVPCNPLHDRGNQGDTDILYIWRSTYTAWFNCKCERLNKETEVPSTGNFVYYYQMKEEVLRAETTAQPAHVWEAMQTIANADATISVLNLKFTDDHQRIADSERPVAPMIDFLAPGDANTVWVPVDPKPQSDCDEGIFLSENHIIPWPEPPPPPTPPTEEELLKLSIRNLLGDWISIGERIRDFKRRAEADGDADRLRKSEEVEERFSDAAEEIGRGFGD